VGAIVSLSRDCTVDASVVAHYEAAASGWWDTTSVARWLHRYNDVRVPYVRDAVCKQFLRDPAQPNCLRGLRVLDIGCGGGVLCEPLAQLGATMVGVDPTASAIGVAALHARENAVNVDYRCSTIEALAADGEKYDVVLAMEVIEHVAFPNIFLERCADLVNPGGLIVLSTINRSVKSFAYAIVMGEYILRLLPRGAHQWRSFVTPAEIRAALEERACGIVDVSGVTMNLRTHRLQLSADTGVNFLLTAAMTGPRNRESIVDEPRVAPALERQRALT
jgi:2-polyprenyl-6-hydroxyphenyl methylase/3-demethylubiquinone-9 3-methyltransferase